MPRVSCSPAARSWYAGRMGRAFCLCLWVSGVAGCGGNVHDSPASGGGGNGGATVAQAGHSVGGAAGGTLSPPAQGAFWANVRSVSPAPSGKMCPSGASLTFDVPASDPSMTPPETLDADTYQHKVVDGEDAAEVTCAVKGAASLSLEGTIKLGLKALAISSGTLGADHTGTAAITLRDSGTPGFFGSLSAPSATCSIDAMATAGNNFQAKPGSIWAHFSCPSVEEAPADYCQAEGYFVLENCDQ